jgi:hypothetical protein
MDRSSVEEPEGVPAVIDLEQQLRDIFRERAETARPDPDLPSVVSRAPRVALTASEPGPSRTRHFVLIAAALVILAGAATTFIAYRSRPTNHSPGTPNTYPKVIPPAPKATDAQTQAIGERFYALEVDGTSLSLVTSSRHDPLGSTELASGSVTDSDGSTPGGFYILTCCTPGGVIWRNGVSLAAGTHMDYLVRSAGPVERVLLDPATSTVTQGISDTPTKIVEPGAIDVALLDVHTMGILVGGRAPKLVVTSGSAASRRVFPLPAGALEPCAIVALQFQFVVLVGARRGNDPCVGDRALVIDGASGEIASTLRMPGEVRGINSDHASKVIAVTTSGNVVLGDFGSEPSWITILAGDYVSAGLW